LTSQHAELQAMTAALAAAIAKRRPGPVRLDDVDAARAFLQDMLNMGWQAPEPSPQQPHRPHITCPQCRRTSWDHYDVREGYCGNCHWWTSDPIIAAYSHLAGE
jgi:hypothetical protein